MTLRISPWIAVATVLAISLACGPSTNSGHDPGADAGSMDEPDASASNTDSGTPPGNDGGSDGGWNDSDDGAPDGGGDGGITCGVYTPVALTVFNYLSWCSVTVGSGTASTSPSQTVCVATGDVTLEATAVDGFVLGDWYGTTGNSGGAYPGTVTGSGQSAVSQVTADATGTSACVSVCCPGANGSEPCPDSNQCAISTGNSGW